MLNQTYKNFEFIFIFNGESKMNEIVKSKFSDKRIRYIEFKENQGSYWSVEHGIQKARGKYIAFIGSDDYWEKDKLELQISALKTKRNIGAVFYTPTLVDQTDNNFFQDGLFSNASEFNGTRFHELHHFFYNMNGLCWSSALIERNLLEKSSWKMGRYKQLCNKERNQYFRSKSGQKSGWMAI